jgi:cell division protein FtsI/penicillin-binding protein 2
MAIGQGEILVTPLQMANMTSAIANRGYYYTPHIIKSIGNTGTDPQFNVKHKIVLIPLILKKSSKEWMLQLTENLIKLQVLLL